MCSGWCSATQGMCSLSPPPDAPGNQGPWPGGTRPSSACSDPIRVEMRQRELQGVAQPQRCQQHVTLIVLPTRRGQGIPAPLPVGRQVIHNDQPPAAGRHLRVPGTGWPDRQPGYAAARRQWGGSARRHAPRRSSLWPAWRCRGSVPAWAGCAGPMYGPSSTRSSRRYRTSSSGRGRAIGAPSAASRTDGLGVVCRRSS